MPVSPEGNNYRISLAEFVDLAAKPLGLHVLSSEDSLSDAFLDSPRVQKLGMALSGFADKVHPGRIQIFGNSERNYVERSLAEEIDKAFERLADQPVTCVLLTAGTKPIPQLSVYCSARNIPVLATDLPSSEAISGISSILSYALAPTITFHGVLMEVFGIGVLLTGRSGIGKSECALELIGRGHRLISDDMVLFRKVGDDIYGEAPAVIKDRLEIRGLGILNARDLFGVSALAPSARVRLCLELLPLDSVTDHDRLRIDASAFSILSVDVLKYSIPVSSGRNIATLVEAAVRVYVSGNNSDH